MCAQMNEQVNHSWAFMPTHWIDTVPKESADEPCRVDSLDVQMHVSGLFAEVVQTIVIANPNKRDISVPLSIPMPDRATVCGYALDIDGVMVDGVIVEKERARVVFEAEQRHQADPGLVEAVKGNVYRTRVYPVLAHGSRTMRLRYVVPLLLIGGRGAALDLPMPAERLGHRAMHIEVENLDCPAPVLEGVGKALFKEVRGCWSVDVEDEDVTPEGCVRVALPELPATFALIERDKEGTVWFSASESVSQQDECAAPPITALTILWDASGSRIDADLAREVGLVRSYCESGSFETVDLVVFSNQVNEVRSFTSTDELVAHFTEVRYDGGTNFAALAEALGEMERVCRGADQGSACVLFTDGLDTVSGEPFAFPGSCDVLAIMSGVQRDAEALRQACKGRAYDIDLAPKDAESLARELGKYKLGKLLGIGSEGVADVCDVSEPDGARRAVIGKLTAEQASIVLDEDADPLVLNADAARAGDVLACAWAARLVSLLASHADDNAAELLSLGRQFGVVSPATSLLVLESLDQWLRYDIEPPETLVEMHESWVQARAGKMNLSSEEELEVEHRKHLEQAWSDVLTWWKTDFSARSATQQGGTGAGGSPEFCAQCGRRTPADARFCPYCGAQVVQVLDGAPDAAFETALPLQAQELYAPDSTGIRAQAEALRTSVFEAPLEDGVAYAASAPMADMGMAVESAIDGSHPSPGPGGPTMAVEVRPWMPDAPYLKELDKAGVEGEQAARVAYHHQRSKFRTSPSFFLDCAGWFMAHGDEEFGLRVLSNLAELRIEDPELLRVMGWRLREAGALADALAILRRVVKLRGEDSQSYRDVALVLDELARRSYGAGAEEDARAQAEEAAELYRKVALTPWMRRPMAVGLFAVEEYNVLRAWADGREWKQAPELPSLGDALEGVLACDLRITLAWDADETDVDIHVTEPNGEEAYYANRQTFAGGRVSEDITDGYGPELYEIRAAQKGVYTIRAHYFASHQQEIFGPATCTLTVYSDWGRPEQSQTITSVRLDKECEMMPIGTASYELLGQSQ